HGWSIVGGRDKQQADGLLHQRASSDVYVRSVFDEGRVQCTEGIAADIKIAAEVRFNRSGIAENLRGKTADHHPIGQFAQQRASSPVGLLRDASSVPASQLDDQTTRSH